MRQFTAKQSPSRARVQVERKYEVRLREGKLNAGQSPSLAEA